MTGKIGPVLSCLGYFNAKVAGWGQQLRPPAACVVTQARVSRITRRTLAHGCRRAKPEAKAAFAVMTADLSEVRPGATHHRCESPHNDLEPWLNCTVVYDSSQALLKHVQVGLGDTSSSDS
jgi:hypothetical protein